MGVNPLEPQISAIRVKNLTFWNFIRFLRSTVYKMAAEVTCFGFFFPEKSPFLFSKIPISTICLARANMPLPKSSTKFGIGIALGSILSASIIAISLYARQREKQDKDEEDDDDENDTSHHVKLLPDTHKYREHLRVAVTAATIAGRGEYLEHMLSAGTVHAKKKNIGITNKSNACDFFTEVDVANERQIIDVIRTAFPQHAIIGEEVSPSSTHSRINPDITNVKRVKISSNTVASLRSSLADFELSNGAVDFEADLDHRSHRRNDQFRGRKSSDLHKYRLR